MRWLRQQPCWYSLTWPEGPTFCKVSRKEGFQARFSNNLAPDPLLAVRLRVTILRVREIGCKLGAEISR